MSIILLAPCSRRLILVCPLTDIRSDCTLDDTDNEEDTKEDGVTAADVGVLWGVSLDPIELQKGWPRWHFWGGECNTHKSHYIYVCRRRGLLMRGERVDESDYRDFVE